MSNTNEAIEQLRPTLQSAGYDIIGNNIVRKLDDGQVRAAELMHSNPDPRSPGAQQFLRDIDDEGQEKIGDRFE